MLNIGLIGDLKQLEPFTRQIQKAPDVQIFGKSSVGTNIQSADFKFAFPEFSRIELIERCDVLFINHFSLIPFAVLTEMVKKSKHIFAAEYPPLTIPECEQLVKLANETKPVFHITNPLHYSSPVRWMNNNIQFPAHIEITLVNDHLVFEKAVREVLLLLKQVTRSDLKKINAVSFSAGEGWFNHIYLQFKNASTVIFNIEKKEKRSELKIEGYCEGRFFKLEPAGVRNENNGSPIDMKQHPATNETAVFLDAIQRKNRDITSINDYLSVLQLLEKINAKIDQFTSR